jgi:hypothetical protein
MCRKYFSGAILLYYTKFLKNLHFSKKLYKSRGWKKPNHAAHLFSNCSTLILMNNAIIRIITAQTMATGNTTIINVSQNGANGISYREVIFIRFINY